MAVAKKKTSKTGSAYSKNLLKETKGTAQTVSRLRAGGVGFKPSDYAAMGKSYAADAAAKKKAAAKEKTSAGKANRMAAAGRSAGRSIAFNAAGIRRSSKRKRGE